MQINKAILHIIDLSTGVDVYADREIPADSELALDFLQGHIEKAGVNPSLCVGRLQASGFRDLLGRYESGALGFVEFSKALAAQLRELLARSDKCVPTDVVVCDVAEDGARGVAFFLLAGKNGYTHHVGREDGLVCNTILRHQAILPSPAQKVDSFALVELGSGGVYYTDTKRSIDGRPVHMIPELLLCCEATPSTREAVKIVERAVTRVAEENGQNPGLAVAKAKSYLGENAAVSESLAPGEMAQKLFEEAPHLQRAFVEEAEQKGLPATVRVNPEYAKRRSRTHKIKTDTGIEITMPVEYFHDAEYVEFVNNPDGSISIQLKNISRILN